MFSSSYHDVNISLCWRFVNLRSSFFRIRSGINWCLNYCFIVKFYFGGDSRITAFDLIQNLHLILVHFMKDSVKWLSFFRNCLCHSHQSKKVYFVINDFSRHTLCWKDFSIIKTHGIHHWANSKIQTVILIWFHIFIILIIYSIFHRIHYIFI